MNDQYIKLLLVEDNPGDARLIREMLSEAIGVSFDIEWVDRLLSGLEYLNKNKVDLILLDLGLPDSQGLDTLNRLLSRPYPVPVIVVISQLADEVLAVQAVRSGAQDYLIKGQADSNHLVRAIRYAIERSRVEIKLAKQLNELQSWQNIILDREDRIQELKREVNELLIRLGEPMRYSSQEIKNQDTLVGNEKED